MSTQQGHRSETHSGSTHGAVSGRTEPVEASLNWGSTRGESNEQATGNTDKPGSFYVDDFNRSSRDASLRAESSQRKGRGGYGLSGGSTGITLLAGIGIGAILMYVFDPDQGRRRRALLRDQIVSCMNETSNIVGRKSRDLRNRAQGVIAETSKALGVGQSEAHGSGARESQTSGASA